MLDLHGKVVKITDEVTMNTAMYSSVTAPGTLMYYKYTSDYSKYIIQTYDFNTGKFTDLFTTVDSTSLIMTQNDKFVFSEGNSKINYVPFKGGPIQLSLQEYYYSISTFFSGEFGAFLWKNTSDQVLYTLVKQGEIMFTKIVSNEENPFQNQIKCIRIA
jgi:hypothetical protein